MTYYRYRHPETGAYHGMGSNKAEACAAARQLNGILLKESDLVGQVIGTAEQDINHLIKRFKEDHLPGKKLAASTLQTTNYRLGRIGRDIGDRQVDQVDVQTIAEYLDDNFERDSYVKHRAMLIELFHRNDDTPVGADLFEADDFSDLTTEQRIRRRMPIQRRR